MNDICETNTWKHASLPLRRLKRRPVSLVCCTICPLVSKLSLGWIVTADGFKTEAGIKPDACGEAKEKFVIIKELASASVVKSESTCV